MTIRCPNCGSTAQIKRELAVPSESPEKEFIFIHYVCGCGCHFAEQYQHSATIQKYVENVRKK